MGFFDELTRMNVAWCESHGLSVGELYGTPPNEAEIETSRLIAHGVQSESAIPAFRARKAKHLRFWPRTPIQQLGYIEEHIKQCGCTPRDNPACHQERSKA